MSKTYKMKLPPQYPHNATPAAKRILDDVEAARGFIPNMYTGMAHSPGLLSTYLHANAAFREQSGFSPQEQEVVLLTVSHENRCNYCVAAHSSFADQQANVPTEITDAIRENGDIPDPKLAALSRFTRVMVASRGNPSDEDMSEFLAAGYQERDVLEVILAIAFKTLSNYANHLFHTEEDERFACRAWVYSDE